MDAFCPLLAHYPESNSTPLPNPRCHVVLKEMELGGHSCMWVYTCVCSAEGRSLCLFLQIGMFCTHAQTHDVQQCAPHGSCRGLTNTSRHSGHCNVTECERSVRWEDVLQSFLGDVSWWWTKFGNGFHQSLPWPRATLTAPLSRSAGLS